MLQSLITILTIFSPCKRIKLRNFWLPTSRLVFNKPKYRTVLPWRHQFAIKQRITAFQKHLALFSNSTKLTCSVRGEWPHLCVRNSWEVESLHFSSPAAGTISIKNVILNEPTCDKNGKNSTIRKSFKLMPKLPYIQLFFVVNSWIKFQYYWRLVLTLYVTFRGIAHRDIQKLSKKVRIHFQIRYYPEYKSVTTEVYEWLRSHFISVFVLSQFRRVTNCF